MIEQQGSSVELPVQCEHICSRHNERIVGICKSPYCNDYRELCQQCQAEHPHPDDYLTWPEAVDQSRELLRFCLNQLESTRLRKNADMESYMRNNMVLLEIENRLTEIKQLINEKIEEFQQEVNRIYFEHVKEKLEDLDDIINKSEKTLKHEIKMLKEKSHLSLARYFTRDLLNEVKYYDSYFNEIFIKKTRNFRTALQNDRILTLVVTFQQNLKKIFTFNHEKTTHDHRQFHLFRQEDGQSALYTLSKDTQRLEKKAFPDIATLVNFPEKYEYGWSDIPESVFYKPNNCYYIIGEGSKTSKQIVKWECSKPVEDSFFAVRSMETERRFFSVCELGGEIYIVGGENSKDGCLARCEKFVPAYSSQIYLIHSLNSRSSRHSLTTYKNKYILKFGGIKRLLDPTKAPLSLRQISAPPQIYSRESEEWSVIPINEELQSQFGFYPSIFKSQNKNMLVILGGDLRDQERLTISIVLEDSKVAEQELKIKKHKTGFKHRGQIHNSTIQVDEDEGNSTFMSSMGILESITLSHIKLHN